jgi:hypothetical protein
MKTETHWETWSFQSDEVPSLDLVCDAVTWCGNIPLFRRTLLPPSSGLTEGSTVLWNVVILPRHKPVCTRLHPKFPDWPPGARSANGTALCPQMQLCRYFVSQPSEFCRHNPLLCFSTRVYCYCCLFRYGLSPETFGYILVCIILHKFKSERRSVRSCQSLGPYVSSQKLLNGHRMQVVRIQYHIIKNKEAYCSHQLEYIYIDNML